MYRRLFLTLLSPVCKTKILFYTGHYFYFFDKTLKNFQKTPKGFYTYLIKKNNKNSLPIKYLVSNFIQNIKKMFVIFTNKIFKIKNNNLYNNKL